MEIAVPTNLAGVAIAEPLHLNPSVDGKGIYYTELFRLYFLLATVYVVEALLLMGLWRVDHDREQDGCPPDMLSAQFACLLIFMTATHSELLADIDILRLIYHAHGEHTWELVGQKEHGALMANESQSFFGAALHSFREAPPRHIPRWTFHQITFRFKCWCVAVVWLPRFAIRLILVLIGGVFIAKSPTLDELVLNTLAVNFICEVGTIFYASFIPPGTKAQIQHMAPVVVEFSNNERFYHWLASTLLYPFISVLLTVFIVSIQAGCGMEDMPESIQRFRQAARLKFFD